MKKITAREAVKIAKNLGACVDGDGTTFYATNGDESELYEFDTRKERDEFVKKNK